MCPVWCEQKPRSAVTPVADQPSLPPLLDETDDATEEAEHDPEEEGVLVDVPAAEDASPDEYVVVTPAATPPLPALDAPDTQPPS